MQLPATYITQQQNLLSSTRSCSSIVACSLTLTRCDSNITHCPSKAFRLKNIYYCMTERAVWEIFSSQQLYCPLQLDHIMSASNIIVCRKKLDKGVLLYIHLNLSFSLLLAFLVFVAGLETATSIPVRLKIHSLTISVTIHYFTKVLCIIISALIEYFFMCSLFWMLGEGIMLYLLIVRVFGKLHTRWYLLLPFCWGM